MASSQQRKHRSGKLKMEYITNNAQRKSTQSKRKKNLFQKAQEIVTLTGAEVFVMVKLQTKTEYYGTLDLLAEFETLGLKKNVACERVFNTGTETSEVDSVVASLQQDIDDFEDFEQLISFSADGTNRIEIILPPPESCVERENTLQTVDTAALVECVNEIAATTPIIPVNNTDCNSDNKCAICYKQTPPNLRLRNIRWVDCDDCSSSFHVFCLVGKNVDKKHHLCDDCKGKKKQ